MRILIMDDEPAAHDRYARCFAPEHAPAFALTHCHHADDALVAVGEALAADDPFSVAYVNRQETARRIRALDEQVNLVFVSGRCNRSPVDIAELPGPHDKIFYIAKPFEVAEVRQTAIALSQRWAADRALAMARAQLRVQVLQLREQSLELAASESRAIHMALHDSLTDAPNRLAFLRALAGRIAQPGRFVTAMVDLDKFKLVNDTLGHLAGDAMIREACATLQRATPEGALVARLGGDEFGLLFDVHDDEAAVAACDRVVAACGATVTVFGHQVQGGASAGLVVSEGGEARDPIDLMRRADLALNEAKRAGRGVARRFDAGMDEGVRVRRRIEDGLREAIARGELSLAYQPIVGRDTLAVEGFEALVRWNTAEHGPISPAIFIPIAAESNVIHELGDWILAEALGELARWPGQYVSINFSPRQFRRQNFVAHVMACVERVGVSPDRVQIEITERAIFDDPERAAATMRELRALGFRIALDDFGTGYSSLRNIRTFALDCLKIDRSFIDSMGRERESAAIVHSIIHLGRALGLGVVAEGVETDAQVQALRIAGASHLQGFYFSEPVPAAEAAQMAAAEQLRLPSAA